MTSTHDQFWSFVPGKWVSRLVSFNLDLATLMAVLGWFKTVVSIDSISPLLIITILTMIVLDKIKSMFYKKPVSWVQRIDRRCKM